MRGEWVVVVDRAFDDVVAFASDFPFQLPRLRGSTLSLRQTSPGPPGLGSTFVSRIVLLGFETQIRGEITEWDWPRLVVLSFTGAGTRRGQIRMSMAPAADGVRIVRSVEIEPKLLFKPFWWIAWPFLKRRSDVSNQNLKQLIEAAPKAASGPSDTPG